MYHARDATAQGAYLKKTMTFISECLRDFMARTEPHIRLPAKESPARSVQRPCSASLSSPALKHQSEIYPPRYRGRVPWKIKMACTVRPDLEWLCKTHGTVAVMDEIYECWVNMHGAVAAICPNGEKLGIKPAEFDVVEWHADAERKAER